MALVKTAVAVVLACSFAQAQFPADVVSITIEADRDTARPGEALTITATSSIDAGWHIYSSDIKGLGPMPSHFEFVDNAGIRAVGPIMEPEPERIWDEGFEMEVGWHSGKVSLSRQVLLSDGLSPGTTEITGVFVYMACTDAMCLPPAEEKFALPIRIEEGEARPAYTFTGTVPPAMAAASGLEGTELQEAIQEGFWAFIMLAVGMGFLALLTPCVFPMIPITVSFFLKQGEDNSMPPLKSAGLYAVGIIVIYSALGLLLALTLGAAGANRMAADPWINLILGALFIYFALSLFGMYEIQLPSALRQFSASQETRGGLLGIFFMAFTFTITSFTCTVQFVGLLLVAASQGHYLWPFIGMVTYAATFALPFFLLALFPQKLAQLPKSGSWLNSVKVVMGFLEFAAAFKFISNSDLVWSWGIFDHQVVLAAWTIILLLTGLYLLGKLQLPHDSPVERTSVPRLLLSGSFLILALLLGAGLTGQKVPGLIEAYLP
ncbi:MAG: thiol:disulfide interchange protein, partial [Candidatus Marinimicrobia bacterium]|nr:thiol:disulfide interchange protein [Candidatus Neomarinimicrobiota bacterium]